MKTLKEYRKKKILEESKKENALEDEKFIEFTKKNLLAHKKLFDNLKNDKRQ